VQRKGFDGVRTGHIGHVIYKAAPQGSSITVPDILSRLIRLKYDSKSLSEDKDILENVINKYYCYNITVIEISDEFKKNIKKEYDNKDKWQEIYKYLYFHGGQIERFFINDDNLIYSEESRKGDISNSI
jgi:hypothetical protein